MAGCYELGIYTALASGPSDLKAAAACDAGHLPDCSMLANRFFQYKHVRRWHRAAAISLYQKACDGGYPEACTGWGIMMLNGGLNGSDFVAARRLFAKACDGGHPEGCSNVATMYMLGDGGPKDRDMAIELMRKACASDLAFACDELQSWGVSTQ